MLLVRLTSCIEGEAPTLRTRHTRYRVLVPRLVLMKYAGLVVPVNDDGVV